MITLTNSFHGTKTRIRANVGDTISARTERRAWKSLCGYSECVCCGAGGTRGGDYWLDDTWSLEPLYIVRRRDERVSA